MTEFLTLGHSNHPIAEFVRILRRHAVRVVVDVRSEPHSRYAPQFNKKRLEQSLNEAGIDYRYSGASLGGRPTDAGMYLPGGKPDYDKLASSEHFQAELRSIVDLAGTKRVCLMCGEADPMCCHRESVVGKVLREWDVKVTHIAPDGRALDTDRGREEQP